MQDRVRRYSDTLEPDAARLVTAIEARRGGDNFRTRSFTPVAAAEGEGEEWYEAVRGPSRSWSVVQYRRAAGLYPEGDGKDFSEEKALLRKVLLRNASFFDALFACAEFEAGAAAQPEQYKPAGMDAEALGKAYYRAYAEAEGIVFDLRDRMPVPVANGEILADDCALGAGALETAKRAAGNLAKDYAAREVSAESIFRDTGASELIVAAKPGAANLPAVAARGNLLATEKENRRRSGVVGTLRQRFHLAADKKCGALAFRTGEGDIVPVAYHVTKGLAGISAGAIVTAMAVPALVPVMAPVAAVGIIGGGLATLFSLIGSLVEEVNPLRALRDNRIVRPVRAFERSLRAAEKKLAPAFAAAGQQDALLDFTGKMRIGFYTLSARYAFKRAANAGALTAPFANMRFAGQMKKLENAALGTGMMGRAEFDRLAESLQLEPDSSRFEESLEYAIGRQVRDFEEKVEELNRHSLRALRQLPAPR